MSPRRPAPLKIVVTGPFDAGKTTLIQSVAHTTVCATERPVSDGASAGSTTVAMDVGRLVLDRDLALYLYGTPGQARFEFMWDILASGMLGWVLLLDGDRLDDAHLQEAGHIRDHFAAHTAAPMALAVNVRQRPLAEGEPQRLRERLALPHDAAVVPVDARERASAKAAVLAVLETLAGRLARPARERQPVLEGGA